MEGWFAAREGKTLNITSYLLLNQIGWYNKSRDFVSFAAYYLPQNAGDIAHKFIKDQQLLSSIDAEVWDICEFTHLFNFSFMHYVIFI